MHFHSRFLLAKAPYKIQEFSGFTILIGRSAADNDILSMEVAQPNDWWLHTADCPGSHIVVRNPDNLSELPPEVLQEATRAAVENSKAKGQVGVKVVLGKAEDLSKPKGSAIGEIHISKHRIIKAAAKIEKLKEYTMLQKYSDQDARQEFAEELTDMSGLGNTGTFKQRFPGVDIASVPFLTDEDAFVEKVRGGREQLLSLTTMLTIYNSAQTQETIEEINKSEEQEDIVEANYNFFKEFSTDVNSEGESYNKGESFKRWYDAIRKGSTIKPPMLLKYRGKYFHIVGQTRQVAALSAGFVLPYLILEENSTK